MWISGAAADRHIFSFFFFCISNLEQHICNLDMSSLGAVETWRCSETSTPEGQDGKLVFKGSLPAWEGAAAEPS